MYVELRTFGYQSSTKHQKFSAVITHQLNDLGLNKSCVVELQTLRQRTMTRQLKSPSLLISFICALNQLICVSSFAIPSTLNGASQWVSAQTHRRPSLLSLYARNVPKSNADECDYQLDYPNDDTYNGNGRRSFLLKSMVSTLTSTGMVLSGNPQMVLASGEDVTATAEDKVLVVLSGEAKQVS